MIARMISRLRRTFGGVVLGLVAALTGCQALDDHARDKVPQYGVIDPHQPRELAMVSMPSHVVEPPDELEISVRPVVLELPLTTVTVQADGVIDLGSYGDVSVAGLTLAQIEARLAEHLAAIVARKRPPVREPIEVSVRLLDGSQSKSYYVLGNVGTQGKFPITGHETVLTAILQAGLRPNSLPEKAYLVRPQPVGGPDMVLRIDWFGIKERGDTLTNYQVFPGDRIIVPGGKSTGLLGALFGGG
jgi:polysaccharide export outer membrane protein